MRVNKKTISMKESNARIISIKNQMIIFGALFILGLLGSWSTGGLFLKEIAIAGVIINALIAFQSFDNVNRKP